MFSCNSQSTYSCENVNPRSDLCLYKLVDVVLFNDKSDLEREEKVSIDNLSLLNISVKCNCSIHLNIFSR